MNRRSFLKAVLGGFIILPPATTYARIWKATRAPIYSFDKFIFPVISNMAFVSLDSISAIQPMQEPSGQVFYLDLKNFTRRKARVTLISIALRNFHRASTMG
jgi:hypothetical protein